MKDGEPASHPARQVRIKCPTPILLAHIRRLMVGWGFWIAHALHGRHRTNQVRTRLQTETFDSWRR